MLGDLPNQPARARARRARQTRARAGRTRASHISVRKSLLHASSPVYASVRTDTETFICCPVPSDARLAGVFVTDRLSRLEDLSRKNFHLSVLCLVYVGVNAACTIINSCAQQFREAHEQPFHMIEFWATFCFAVVQVYSTIFSPRSFGSIYEISPGIFKTMIFLSLVTSFVPAVLISISLEDFEGPAHQVEYANELTMSFIDLVMLANVARAVGKSSSWKVQRAVGFLAPLIAGAQLCIYNFLDGPSGAVRSDMRHVYGNAGGNAGGHVDRHAFDLCLNNQQEMCVYPCVDVSFDMCVDVQVAPASNWRIILSSPSRR